MADAYKLDATVWENRIVGHEEVRAGELLAHPDNFRIHGKLQQDVTAGSLNDIGWVKSVVVNENTGRIVDGHLRVTLAMRKGEGTLVPVEYVNLTEAEEAQALVSLDYMASLATPDAEKLEALMHEIQTDDSDLQQMFADMASEAGLTFGDTQQESLDAEPQIDRAEELRQKWGVELGQVWRLPSRTEGQEHRVICGDCTNVSLGNIDAVLTDPPYGVNMDKGFSGSGGFSDKPIKRREYSDDWDSTTPESLDHVLVSDTVIVFGGNCLADKLPASSHWLVWDKHNTMPTFGDCELAWTSVDRKSVKKYDFVYNGLIGKESDRFHPTQKPVGLFELILKDYTETSDIVADFYAGSFTTLIASENLSRQCRAVEISPAYVAVGLQRYYDTFGIMPELIEG